MPDYLVLDSDVSAEGLTTALFEARNDPVVSSPSDATDRLVGQIEHPETGEEALVMSNVPFPIRNPNPPTLPNGVTLPDEAQGGGPPNVGFWHERLPLNKWGTVQTRTEMEEAGWFPDSL